MCDKKLKTSLFEKKIKLDYFKKFETKSIKQKKKIAFLPKQTLEMREQWSRV